MICFFAPRLAPEACAALEDLDPDAHSARFDFGWMIWITQTCSRMKQTGLPVRLSNRLLPGAVNIGHMDDLAGCDPNGHFIVCVQADRQGTLPFAQATLVQNKTQADPKRNRIWLPHWPQPGLIPRDPKRQQVRNVAYAGRLANIAPPPHLFSALCRECGLQPMILGPGRWHDFSQVDLLVGIRSLDSNPHDGKPPTKLVNAWLAGVPFIGGYDSAFAAAGQPDTDYLRVGSMDELRQALLMLRDDSARYASLVAAGFARVRPYTVQKVALHWRDLLEKILPAMYEEWRNGRSKGPAT